MGQLAEKSGELTKEIRENRYDKVKETLELTPAQAYAFKQMQKFWEKEFGEGAIMPLGSDHQARIEGIPTGSLSVDLALGGFVGLGCQGAGVGRG